MYTENPRTRRVGEQIQRLLAQLVQTEVKDPRVGMVTVSAVRVSPDLSRAKVFVTTLQDAADREVTLRVLNRAAGFLRKRIGQQMTTRTVPQLDFVNDDSIEYGARLSALIDGVVPDHEPDAD